MGRRGSCLNSSSSQRFLTSHQLTPNPLHTTAFDRLRRRVPTPIARDPLHYHLLEWSLSLSKRHALQRGDCLRMAVARMSHMCYAGAFSAGRLPCSVPAAVPPTSEERSHHAVCSGRCAKRVAALSAHGHGSSAMPIHNGH